MQTMKVLMGMYNVTVNFKTFIHPNLTPVVSFFHDIKDIVPLIQLKTIWQCRNQSGKV